MTSECSVWQIESLEADCTHERARAAEAHELLESDSDRKAGWLSCYCWLIVLLLAHCAAAGSHAAAAEFEQQIAQQQITIREMEEASAQTQTLEAAGE